MALALRCAPNRIIIIQKHSPLKKPARNRAVMLAQPQSSVTIFQINNTPFLQINKTPSTFKNKVFEDPSEGIVCYTDDDTGEITCEGYDEGPRFHHQHLTRLTCNTAGDAEMIDVLQRSWLLQLVDPEDAAAKISTPLDSTTYYAN